MSKLDDAFLKAYAKVRGGAVRPEPQAVADELPWAEETPVWLDTDAEDFLRPDRGVFDVASFIAQTSDGRTRGSTTQPGNESPLERRSPVPLEPQLHTAPVASRADTEACLIDPRHVLRGPHFQPITLDLDAFDVLAPAATSVEAIAGGPPVSDRPIIRADSDHEKAAARRPLRDDSRLAKTAVAQRHVEAVQSAAVEVPKPCGGSRGLEPDNELELVSQLATAPWTPSPVTPPAAELDFQAVWEVDRFEFEKIVSDLSADASPLWQAAEQLRAACAEGLKTLAITSPNRGEGRSTLAITLARMLAASELRVVLLDGDMECPSLADKLRLDIGQGWSDVARSGLSAEEVAVHSVEDRFTVLPLAPPKSPSEGRPSAAATAKMLRQLGDHFDVVIIDTADLAAADSWIPGCNAPCMIDAALVLQDLRSADNEAMQACLDRLHELGIANVGLVENFAGH